MAEVRIKHQCARVFVPLLREQRYLAAYGGRGSGKSHFFAEKLIIRAATRTVRAACIREVQNTLKESVRQLLIDKIQALGLSDKFEVLEGEIRGPHGSLIIFRGMQSYNADSIKSLEGFDVVWVEEAQTLSERSLRVLRPTLRKDGSQLWFSWNPRYETDAVDKFFRGKKPPDDAIIVAANWYDNPWFTDVLVSEKSHDYETDPEMAEHVWGGGYETVGAGAYYAKHIARLEKDGRVGHFPHIPELPVFTGWDLGVDDYTAIWFFQVRYLPDMKPRIRIIDYYEASGLGANEVMAEALPEYTQDFQERIAAMVEAERKTPFKYQRHFLPHDIGHREWGNEGARRRVQTLNNLGIPLDKIHQGSPDGPDERVNAVRQILPICEFHRCSRVMLGLSRLRRYSRKLNEALGTYVGPLKDGNDHGADAFGEFAINCGISNEPAPPDRVIVAEPGKFIAPSIDQLIHRRKRVKR